MNKRVIASMAYAALTTTPMLSVAEESAVSVKSWEVGALIEIEAFATDSEGFTENSASDIVVATVEVGVGAQLNDYSRADVYFLYEEDDTDLEVDVATLTFGNDESGLMLVLGQNYLPFGSFETALVNDTLVLEVAETRETAAELYYSVAGITLGTYLFRGDGDDSHATEFGALIAYGAENFTVGISYINNLLDSDGVSGFIEDELGGFDTVGHDYDLAAADFNMGVNVGGLGILFEYLETESIDEDLALAGFGKVDESLTVAHLEFNYTATISGREFTWAAAVQQTEEAQFLGLPETRASIGMGVGVTENILVGVEIWSDQDYDEEDGGTDESANTVVIQVAAGF